jgi:hypothetical protein
MTFSRYAAANPPVAADRSSKSVVMGFQYYDGAARHPDAVEASFSRGDRPFGDVVTVENTSEQLSDHNVEHGCEDEAEKGYAQHPVEHRRAKRDPHFRTRARRDIKWHNPKREGERRHQDGPKSQPASLDRRLEAIPALRLKLRREFHNQDGVFGREADQHDEADLGEDVHVRPMRPHAQDRGQKAHRNNEDDGERKAPALILRRQREVNEQNRKAEDWCVSWYERSGIRKARSPMIWMPSPELTPGAVVPCISIAG